YLDHYQSTSSRTLILDQLTKAGASPGQVEFLHGRESQAAFLARYNDIDVALDTFPFCGSTTSFHALAMGVPVVTWPWDRFVWRRRQGGVQPVTAALARGIEHQKAGRLEAARTVFEGLVRRAPDNVDATHLLGTVCRQLGRLDDAARWIGRAIELKPDYAAAH